MLKENIVLLSGSCSEVAADSLVVFWRVILIAFLSGFITRNADLTRFTNEAYLHITSHCAKYY